MTHSFKVELFPLPNSYGIYQAIQIMAVICIPRPVGLVNLMLAEALNCRNTTLIFLHKMRRRRPKNKELRKPQGKVKVLSPFKNYGRRVGLVSRTCGRVY